MNDKYVSRVGYKDIEFVKRCKDPSDASWNDFDWKVKICSAWRYTYALCLEKGRVTIKPDKVEIEYLLSYMRAEGHQLGKKSIGQMMTMMTCLGLLFGIIDMLNMDDISREEWDALIGLIPDMKCYEVSENDSNGQDRPEGHKAAPGHKEGDSPLAGGAPRDSGIPTGGICQDSRDTRDRGDAGPARPLSGSDQLPETADLFSGSATQLEATAQAGGLSDV